MRPSPATAHPVSADEALADMRRQTARVLHGGLAACEGTRAQLAASLDCGASRLAQMADAHDDATICVARAALLPDPARVALAQHVAGERYTLVELGESDDLGDDMRHAVELQRTSSGALAAQLEAIADGHITAAEGAAIEAASDALLAATLRVRAVAQRAQRERVIATRRLGVAR